MTNNFVNTAVPADDPKDVAYAKLNRQYGDLSRELVNLEGIYRSAEEESTLAGKNNSDAKAHLIFIEGQMARVRADLSEVFEKMDGIVLDKIL